MLKKKNRFLMQQTRLFILTSEPRLKYYKNDLDFRGEIPLTQDVKIKSLGGGMFAITTCRKTYNIREINVGEADQWVEAINNAIIKYASSAKSSIA